ncbi:MAG: VWA domain-containing protein [Phycisphaerae bacterium]
MNDFDIDAIDRLKWLLLVAACAAVMIYGFVQRGRALRVFAAANLFGVLMPDASRARRIVKAGVLLLAMVMMVVALVGPRWGRYFAEVYKKRLDVIVCLDVSRSMLAEDAGMSRLARAKDDVEQMLDSFSGGMVGLVAFAGKANLVCPLTDDAEFFRLTLKDVGVHSAPIGGTDLGAAIAAGARAFTGEGGQHKVILLITDGEDHAGRGVDAAKKARQQSIEVYAVGIGDPERGGLIPIEKDGEKTYLVYEGQQLWSKLDPGVLDAIARAGGTERYYRSGRVNASQRTLEWIYTDKIAPKTEQTKGDRRAARLYPRFHWFAAAAVLLLLIESLVSERRSPAARPRKTGEPS